MGIKNIYLRENIRTTVNEHPARELMYDLTLTYAKYMNIHHQFLADDGLTSTEAHTLKHICQNPGVTITDIVHYWGRTKGTVSAQISKLEEKGLVKKEKCRHNGKVTHILPTEKGLEMHRSHMEFDIEETLRFYDKWEEKYTVREMEQFWEMMAFYKEFLEERINQR